MKVFISYTREKDELPPYPVTRLYERFQNELRQLVPGSTVFLDQASIGAGERFEEKIRQELNDASLLMILISPAWFDSNPCAEEFKVFSLKQTDRGPRPILPLLWAGSVPQATATNLRERERALAGINYRDWRTLRHHDPDDPEFRNAVAELAGEAKALVQ